MNNTVIDADTFNEVRELMDDALGSFINTFIANSPIMIQQIADGIASGDIETVYLSAHQLKGGSGSIGASKLSEIAFKIEKAGKANETDIIPDLISQLRDEYQAVEVELIRLSKT